MDDLQSVAMALEELGQRCRQVLDQGEAIRHLGRLGRPVPGAVSIGFGPIPRDPLHARVALEPLRERVAVAVRKQGAGLVAFQRPEDGAIGRAFAQGEIVYAPQAGRGAQQGWRPPEQAQQSIAAPC
jgi:hypothetical protein